MALTFRLTSVWYGERNRLSEKLSTYVESPVDPPGAYKGVRLRL